MPTAEPEFEAVIAERREVGPRISVIDLVAASGSAPLADAAPGDHVDVVIDDVVRQYSLTGRPAPGVWRIAVLETADGRGGAAALRGAATPGAALRLRGPRNHFPFRPAERLVFIAGGIGITPILPMVLEAERAGADWRLHYAAASRSEMPFLDELAAFGDRVECYPRDEGRRLPLDEVLGDVAGAEVYCCGPERMLAAAEEHARTGSGTDLHLERFEPRTDTGMHENHPFDVELADSGATYRIEAEQSILEVLNAAGEPVFYSCSEGTCGTCETRVVSGTPDHRDSVLTDEEHESNEVMMICVSRCVGERLVLQLG